VQKLPLEVEMHATLHEASIDVAPLATFQLVRAEPDQDASAGVAGSGGFHRAFEVPWRELVDYREPKEFVLVVKESELFRVAEPQLDRTGSTTIMVNGVACAERLVYACSLPVSA
jgi:hypothetical protein